METTTTTITRTVVRTTCGFGTLFFVLFMLYACTH